MIIYALYTLTCIHTGPLIGLRGDSAIIQVEPAGVHGNTISDEQCRWDGGNYNLFVAEKDCLDAGEVSIGKDVFSDVADGRKVKDYRCAEITVRDQGAK